MVAGVVRGAQLPRVGRVAHREVGVDDLVEDAARPDLRVDALAHLVLRGRPGPVAPVRHEGRADDVQAACVGALGEAAQGAGDPRGVGLLRERLYVVDAEGDDDRLHAGDAEDVALEAVEAARADAVAQQAVAA